MAWELVTRDDFFEGSNAPFISVSKSHFSFNAAFVRHAELEPASRATVYVDSDNRKIGFEFHADDRRNSFSLSAASSDKKGQKRKALQCAATGTVQKHKWIEAVTKENAKNRRFSPRKEGGKWVIQLCPAFEERRARESRTSLQKLVASIVMCVKGVKSSTSAEDQSKAVFNPLRGRTGTLMSLSTPLLPTLTSK